MKIATASSPCPGAEELKGIIEATLEDDKAEDVIVIDLAGKTTIADYMIVASGRSNRHVAALAEHVIERAKGSGVPLVRTEGMKNCDWVLLDAGDVVVHIFRPEVRAFYQIEKMWLMDQPGAGQKVMHMSA